MLDQVVHFRRFFGVTELAPSGQAADEMRKLWQSLKRRFGKAAAAKPVRRAA